MASTPSNPWYRTPEAQAAAGSSRSTTQAPAPYRASNPFSRATRPASFKTANNSVKSAIAGTPTAAAVDSATKAASKTSTTRGASASGAYGLSAMSGPRPPAAAPKAASSQPGGPYQPIATIASMGYSAPKTIPKTTTKPPSVPSPAKTPTVTTPAPTVTDSNVQDVSDAANEVGSTLTGKVVGTVDPVAGEYIELKGKGLVPESYDFERFKAWRGANPGIAWVPPRTISATSSPVTATGASTTANIAPEPARRISAGNTTVAQKAVNTTPVMEDAAFANTLVPADKDIFNTMSTEFKNVWKTEGKDAAIAQRAAFAQRQFGGPTIGLYAGKTGISKPVSASATSTSAPSFDSTLPAGQKEIYAGMDPKYQAIWKAKGIDAAIQARGEDNSRLAHGGVDMNNNVGSSTQNIAQQKDSTIATTAPVQASTPATVAQAAAAGTTTADRTAAVNAERAARIKAAEDAKAEAEAKLATTNAFGNTLTGTDRAAWDKATPEQRENWASNGVKPWDQPGLGTAEEASAGATVDPISTEGTENRERSSIETQDIATEYLKGMLNPSDPRYKQVRDNLMQDLYGAGAAAMAATRTQAAMAGFDPEQIQSMTIAQQRSNLNQASQKVGELAATQDKERSTVAQYLDEAGLKKEQWLEGDKERELKISIGQVGLDQALEDLRQDKAVNPLLVDKLNVEIDQARLDLDQDKPMGEAQLEAVRVANETAKWKLAHNKELAPYEVKALALSVDQAQFDLDKGKTLLPYQVTALGIANEQAAWDLEHGKKLEPHQIKAMELANRSEELSYDVATYAFNRQQKADGGADFQAAVMKAYNADPKKFAEGSWKSNPEIMAAWNAYAPQAGMSDFATMMATMPSTLENNVKVASMNDTMVAMAQLDSQKWFTDLPDTQQQSIKQNLSMMAMTGGGTFTTDTNGDLVYTSALGDSTTVFNNKVTQVVDPNTREVTYEDGNGDPIIIDAGKYFSDIAKFSPATIKTIDAVEEAIPGSSESLRYLSESGGVLPSKVNSVANELKTWAATTPGTHTDDQIRSLSPQARTILEQNGVTIPTVTSVKQSNGVIVPNTEIASRIASGSIVPITTLPALEYMHDDTGVRSAERGRISNLDAFKTATDGKVFTLTPSSFGGVFDSATGNALAAPAGGKITGYFTGATTEVGYKLPGTDADNSEALIFVMVNPDGTSKELKISPNVIGGVDKGDKKF